MKPSVATEPSPDLTSGRSKRSVAGTLADLPPWVWPLVALLALVAAVVVIEMIKRGETNFLKPANLKNVLNQQSYVGVVAVGMTFVIIAGGIDLSVGALLAATGVIALLSANKLLGTPPADATTATVWFAVLGGYLAAIFAGGIAGALHGVLVAKFRIAAFVATLGGLAAYRSLALTLGESGEVRYAGPQPESYLDFNAYQQFANTGITVPFTNIAPNAPEPIPLLINWPIIVFLLTVVLGALTLSRTRFGRHTIAVGSNERAARYSALPVDGIKIAVFVLLGLLTGLAAIMNTSRSGTISSGNTGILLELDAIAAVVVGGTRLSGGRGTVIGTLFGVLILGVIGNMLTLLEVESTLQGMVKGGVIVLAVLLQRRT